MQLSIRIYTNKLMYNFWYLLFSSCRRIPTLRLSVQHLVPTATHVTSAIQYFAPSQKYVRSEETAPSLSLDSAHSYFTSFRWYVSLQQPALSFFVCRLTSCWSLSSAAHLCTTEFRWNYMLPGSRSSVFSMHTFHKYWFNKEKVFKIVFCNKTLKMHSLLLSQWQCRKRRYFGGQQCSAAEFCSVWTGRVC